MSSNEYYDESSAKMDAKLEHDSSMASENRKSEFLALQRRATLKIDLIVSRLEPSWSSRAVLTYSL
jgi:hypothetical protein